MTPFAKADLIERLVTAGELEVAGAPAEEIARYFDVARFKFHGPDGFETDYNGLNAYFASIRAAFIDRSIRRGIMLADGDLVACQAWIEGRFVDRFTMSPIGLIEPNGAVVTWDLINLFRFNDVGQLIEEHVRTDYRSFLRQLGAADA